MCKQRISTINRIIDGCEAISDAAFTSLLTQSSKQLSDAVGVPRHFVFLLLAIEDKPFMKHKEVDPFAILRAALSNAAKGTALQGASTITQQLYYIHNNLDQSSLIHDMSYKIKQSMWALAKETSSNKSEILSDYLSSVYWG